MLHDGLALPPTTNALVHPPCLATRTSLFGMKEDMDRIKQKREDNDFLSIAASMGLANETNFVSERERLRTLDAKNPKSEYYEDSEFQAWARDLVAGTPMAGPDGGGDAMAGTVYGRTNRIWWILHP